MTEKGRPTAQFSFKHHKNIQQHFVQEKWAFQKECQNKIIICKQINYIKRCKVKRLHFEKKFYIASMIYISYNDQH